MVVLRFGQDFRRRVLGGHVDQRGPHQQHVEFLRHVGRVAIGREFGVLRPVGDPQPVGQRRGRADQQAVGLVPGPGHRRGAAELLVDELVPERIKVPVAQVPQRVRRTVDVRPRAVRAVLRAPAAEVGCAKVRGKVRLLAGRQRGIERCSHPSPITFGLQVTPLVGQLVEQPRVPFVCAGHTRRRRG